MSSKPTQVPAGATHLALDKVGNWWWLFEAPDEENDYVSVEEAIVEPN